MKQFNEYSTDELIHLINQKHNEEKISLREIAKELNTYVVKLSRFCTKYRIPTLSKAESLKEGYKSNRIKPSMKGKKRSEEEKARIAESQHKYWESLSEEEKNRRRVQQSEIFAQRKDKREFSQKGCKAIRRAADEGSKFEKALIRYFNKKGIDYIHHYSDLLPHTKLEVDFFLPRYNLVIEVDGPSHFSADFGIDNYSSQLKADQKKNGLVLRMGASIIRLQHRKALYNRDYKKVEEILDELIYTINNELKVINVEEI